MLVHVLCISVYICARSNVCTAQHSVHGTRLSVRIRPEIVKAKSFQVSGILVGQLMSNNNERILRPRLFAYVLILYSVYRASL